MSEEIKEEKPAESGDAIAPDNTRAQKEKEQAEKEKKPKFSEKMLAKHDEVKKLLKDGISISDIAAQIGFERHSVARFIHGCKDLDKIYQDTIERKLDICEAVVMNIATIPSDTQVTDGGAFASHDGRVMTANLNAAKFYLERMGAKRGWNAKIETKEVGNGTRPMIVMGDVPESLIAEAEAHVKAVNEKAIEEDDDDDE